MIGGKISGTRQGECDMRRIGCLLIAIALTMAGCGSVNWLPEYVRQPTTPDQFSFTTKTGAALSTAVTSDPITVAGLTAASSPISVTGSVGSNSLYSINGGTATAAAGTVKNGDKVTVTHTSATTLGSATISTLTIGNITGTFTSITQTIESFTRTATGLPGERVNSGAIALNLVSGLHTISITNGLYAFDSISGTYSSNQQTIEIFNGRTIFLQNTASTVSGDKVTTTLTIDGVASTFTTTTR
jgi:hypothetical protein